MKQRETTSVLKFKADVQKKIYIYIEPAGRLVYRSLGCSLLAFGPQLLCRGAFRRWRSTVDLDSYLRLLRLAALTVAEQTSHKEGAKRNSSESHLLLLAWLPFSLV